MTKITVKEQCTLSECLLQRGYKQSTVRHLLKFGAVTLNERPLTRYDHPVSPGDELVISTERKHEVRPPFPLIYEDDALVVINKPAGLLSISTERERKETAYYQLNAYLKARAPEKKERVFIVHRLDQETSGILLFAKSEEVKKRLQEHWKKVDKKYLAIVEGPPKKRDDTIRSFLKETRTHMVYATKESEGAEYAVTHYRVLKASAEYALLEVDLETGKKNQIRIHLAQIKHPIAGDKKYGARTNPFKRLALHAYTLSFKHPVTKRMMQFKSELPKEFQNVVRAMK